MSKVGKVVSKATKSVSKHISSVFGSNTISKLTGGVVGDIAPAMMNVFVPGLGTMYSVAQLAQGKVGGYAGGGSALDLQGVTQLARITGKGIEGGTGAFGHEAEKQFVQNSYESTALGGYKQQAQDQMKELARRAKDAAYVAGLAQEQMNAQSMIGKKMAMLGEQESERAGRPVKNSYLGSNSMGVYVDEAELKEKKRLGGQKRSTGAEGKVG